PGPEEQLECSRDALLILQGVRPLGPLVGGPCHAPDLRHRREAVVELRRIPACLGGVAPRDVDAHASSARRVFPSHVALVVGTSAVLCAHNHVSGCRTFTGTYPKFPTMRS